MIDRLRRLREGNAAWTKEDKPVLVADGRAYPIRSLTAPTRAEACYVVGADDRALARVAELVTTPILGFYEMRVRDLTPLTRISTLEHLAIEWNTKVTDLASLGALARLRTLVLVDTPKANSLDPLARLSRLEALEFAGGIWSKNRATTLADLAELPALRELRLANLRVDDPAGLRPLSRLRQLQRLSVSNQFATEDYAFLSVMLPGVECEMFAPYLKLNAPLGEHDVMVVGRRKPWLDSRKDGARMAMYAERFRALQADFAAAI